MPALADLYEPIAADLQRVCRTFEDELFSDLPVVNDLCGQIRRFRGKLLRPALLLLAGRACGRTTEEHITLAAVVEMVHMATLVHDDVLDEADMRRRSPTINRLRGNEAAVLLGDYLISHAFHLCSSLDSTHAARAVAAITNIVCEGELQQVHHRGRHDLSVEQYLEIIHRKTAALTGLSCMLGATFAGADRNAVRALERFGLDAGMAFQIIDDALDIDGSEEQMGKTLGRDLAEGKLTLPVIHSLQHGDREHRARLEACLAAEQPDRTVLRRLLEETGSLAAARASAAGYVRSATGALGMLPPGAACDALARLAGMIVDRRS